MKTQVILCGNTWELLLYTNIFCLAVSSGILGKIILLFGGKFQKILERFYIYFESFLFPFCYAFILHTVVFSKVFTLFPFSLTLYLPIILPLLPPIIHILSP